MKLKTITFKCRYWKPGENIYQNIPKRIKNQVKDGDIVALSEKALSTAMGNIFDEENIAPGLVAQFLAKVWVRRMWGGPLGALLGLKEQTLDNLRNYPEREGAAHKQLALQYAGLLQSLRHYSEGGIDASNLPFSYVSLPLRSPRIIAKKIRNEIKKETGKKVSVMIVDGDTTYTWRNLHLAPRNIDTPGIIHFGGVITFIIGKIFELRSRQTPISVVGDSINPDQALWFAQLFHKVCGRGAGRTAWSMSKKMNTSITGVTWKMLESVEHYPISIIRVLE